MRESLVGAHLLEDDVGGSKLVVNITKTDAVGSSIFDDGGTFEDLLHDQIKARPFYGQIEARMWVSRPNQRRLTAPLWMSACVPILDGRCFHMTRGRVFVGQANARVGARNGFGVYACVRTA